jgi:hypothetical protein
MLKPIAICTILALALMSPAAAQDATQPDAPTTMVAAADDVPQAVKDACKDDYEKHCSAHKAESAEARGCMAHAFEKLSDPCVTAILDSPLVEQEQQRLANAQASEANNTKIAKNVRTVKAKPAVRTVARIAKVKHAPNTKYAAVKKTRHVAHRASAPRRSVTAHIRRGTSVASRYVAKYTRFAFAKVFR